MPVRRSKDSKGPFYRWGDNGKKYHFSAGNKTSRTAARLKAEKQGRAARVAGYRT